MVVILACAVPVLTVLHHKKLFAPPFSSSCLFKSWMSATRRLASFGILLPRVRIPHSIDGCEAARWPHQRFDQAGALVEKTRLGSICVPSSITFSKSTCAFTVSSCALWRASCACWQVCLGTFSTNRSFSQSCNFMIQSLVQRGRCLHAATLRFRISTFQLLNFNIICKITVESDSHQPRIETYFSTRLDRDHNQLRRNPRISQTWGDARANK